MKNFADRPSSDAKLPTNDFQVVSKARSWRHQGYIKASHSDLIDPYWWFKSLYVLHPTDDDHKQHFSLMRMVWKYHSADGTCQKLFSARSQLLSSTQLTSQLHRKIGIRVNKWSPAQPQILVMCADGHLFNYLFFKRNWSFSLGRGFSQCDPKNTQKKQVWNIPIFLPLVCSRIPTFHGWLWVGPLWWAIAGTWTGPWGCQSWATDSLSLLVPTIEKIG